MDEALDVLSGGNGETLFKAFDGFEQGPKGEGNGMINGGAESVDESWRNDCDIDIFNC